jgi:hypothetical protein
MSKWHRAEGDDKTFLADLEADPGETKNLSKQHPDLVEKLSKLHDEWRSSLQSN